MGWISGLGVFTSIWDRWLSLQELEQKLELCFCPPLPPASPVPRCSLLTPRTPHCFASAKEARGEEEVDHSQDGGKGLRTRHQKDKGTLRILDNRTSSRLDRDLDFCGIRSWLHHSSIGKALNLPVLQFPHLHNGVVTMSTS